MEGYIVSADVIKCKRPIAAFIAQGAEQKFQVPSPDRTDRFAQGWVRVEHPGALVPFEALLDLMKLK